MIRVYADIVGDLFHFGHVRFLKRARECGDRLVVGVTSDADVEAYKRTPIFSMIERVEMIQACRYVDEVIPAAPAPVTEEFLVKHAIDLVIHGDDFNEESMNYWYSIPIRLGKFRMISYTEGISTTEIINRIIESQTTQ